MLVDPVSPAATSSWVRVSATVQILHRAETDRVVYLDALPCIHNLHPTYAKLIADVSYCQWSGIACCETAGDFFNQYCSQGSQSVAQIFLTGKTSHQYE